MTASGSVARCAHDMLPGQCAPCAEAKERKKALAKPGARASSPQVRRLVEALRAEHRGRTKSKAERKLLAQQVQRALAPLGKADRRLARRIASEPQRRRAASNEQRVREDKLAGIYAPWVSPQNVGRGKRS